MEKINKYQSQTVQVKTDFSGDSGSSPFLHVGGWDFVILFLAILLRFVVMAKNKIKQLNTEKREFNFVDYFDFRHGFRWVAHTITALIGILVLPEIFVNYIQPKYFNGLEIWTLFGSGVNGVFRLRYY